MLSSPAGTRKLLKNRYSHLINAILILALIFSLFGPVAAETAVSGNHATSKNVISNVSIVGTAPEITTERKIFKRGLNYNDYILPDGIHVVEVATFPINYLKGGRYVPINGTIKSDRNGHFVDEGIYKARWGRDSSVLIEKDDFYIKFQNKYMHVGNVKKPFIKRSEKIKGHKIAFKLAYPDVDVEYEYLPTILKETYILKKPPAKSKKIKFSGILHHSPELAVVVDGKEVEGEIETNRSISFIYGDKIIFKINHPFIYDSNLNFTYGSYLIVREGNHLRISLKVPEAWLNDSNRKYPVYIDPAVSIYPSNDAELVEYSPDWNYGSSIYLAVQSKSGADVRAILKFSLPSYIDADSVTNAMLQLYKDFGSTGSGDRYIEIREALHDSWDEDTITWNNQPGYRSTVLDVIRIGDSGYKYFGRDVENFINAVKNNLAGDGVLSLYVKDSSEDSPTKYTQYFFSSEYSTTYRRPILYIYYTEPDTEDPTTEITSPSTGSWQNQGFYVHFSDSDTGGSGLSYCQYRVVSDGTVTKDWTDRDCNGDVWISVGPYSWKYCQDEGRDVCTVYSKAVDGAGNWATDYRSFSIDWTPPSSAITSPSAGSWHSEDFTVSVTDSDAVSGVYACYYMVKSGGVTTRDWTLRSCSSSVTISVGSSGDCRHEGSDMCTVYVRARDRAGNYGITTSRSFSISLNQPPVISSITAEPQSVPPGGSSTITVVASDPDGDPLSYSWSASGGSISGSGAQVTWTAPGVAGTYTVTATVSDGKGGSDSASVSISVAGLPDLAISEEDIVFERVGGG
jgi:hypothetical protein